MNLIKLFVTVKLNVRTGGRTRKEKLDWLSLKIEACVKNCRVQILDDLGE